MTQTMLERAARAVGEAVGYRSDDILDKDSLAFDIARAVLMAVRVPSDAMSKAVRTTEGWEDMIDAILNEGETK